jgi:hypothetical protein
MDLKKMSSQELVRTLVRLSIESDDTDLDLVSSGKTLSRAMARIRKEIFSRMEGGENEENKNLLQEISDTAVRANFSQNKCSYVECLSLMKTVAQKMRETASVTA